jgi:predicted thioesterase
VAYCFGDSFDCYASTADMALGYWDSGGTGVALSLVAGRFAGSQAAQWNSSSPTPLVKSSATNDAVHHLSVAFRQTAALSGTTLAMYFQFTDGATNQCCIVFRSDGAILLTSATPGGTVLATYGGAVTAQTTWFQFEFEIVINNTAGSFKVRKNGSATDDHSTTGINTRPGANAYANKLTVAMSAVFNAQQIDDLLWRSDAASVPWVGDVRCYARMPAADASVQFARAPSSFTASIGTSSSSSALTGTPRYAPLVASFSGTFSALAISINTAFTGNLKCSIFADNAGSPGAVLGSATTISNPVVGSNTLTFVTPITVVKGASYWIGTVGDVLVSYGVTGGSTGRAGVGGIYATFPVANPPGLSSVAATGYTANITTTISADLVNETLQDGTTTYVYDAVAGHADFYNVAALPTAPASTVAVTTRAFVAKGDAGTRTGAVQLKSGGSTVASPTLALSTSFGWTWRTDSVDPATSTAWTAAAVSACTIGPAVIA